MKKIKWKIFIITSVVCLLPMLFGLSIWNSLPDTMAIHFNIYGEADGFASKGFVVFGLPVLMVLLQLICCLINDLNAYYKGERKKFEMATKWIIPFMTVTLQILTLGIGLGWDIEVNKAVSLIIGIVFLVIGNYLPKFDYVKNYNLDTEKARKINRFIGYGSVVMGVIFLISMFLPPISTLICILLLIPYAIISVVYGIVVGRK